MTDRIHPAAIDATGYVGDGERYLSDDGTWKTPPGSGVVEAVVPGTGIEVDSTDPANPVVSATGGGGGAAAFVGCKARRSTSQSAASGATVAIQFNDPDDYDTSSLHDPAVNNTRITVPTGLAGVWRVTCYVAFSNGAASVRHIQFSINGTSAEGAVRVNVGGSMWMVSTADLLLAEGDWVAVEAIQSSGGSLNLTGTFSAQYLGAP